MSRRSTVDSRLTIEVRIHEESLSRLKAGPSLSSVILAESPSLTSFSSFVVVVAVVVVIVVVVVVVVILVFSFYDHRPS